MSCRDNATTDAARSSRSGRGLCFLLTILLGILGASSSFADVDSEIMTNAGARAALIYRQALARYTNATENLEAAWRFARACFDYAEFARTGEDRERLGTEGAAAARKAISINPTNGAGHYYLGMNLGQIARTKTVAALKLVIEMESEFLKAREYDEKLDFGGPDRSLGLLYLDAPGWPISIGNRLKALEHLNRALELGPEFPENHLCVMEAFVQWEDFSKVGPQLAKLMKLWPDAVKRFTGDEYASTWVDWTNRLAAIQSKMKDKKAVRR